VSIKQPLVSVIVVNYNGKSYLAECLDSVLDSDYLRFEVVVVDNGSTDGSWQWLKKRYGRNRRAKLIESKQNLFFTGGSNLGARKARGEKLIFLNSDTRVDKNWIKELVLVAGKNKKWLVQPKILVYGKQVIDNVGGDYYWPGIGKGRGSGQRDKGQYDQDCQVNFANGTVFLIDRKFFWQLGGFDDEFKLFYEDVDLNLQAIKAGGKAWYAHKSKVEHKGGVSLKENIVSDLVLFYSRRNRLITVYKNFRGLDRVVRLVSLVVMSLVVRRRKMSFKAMSGLGDWLLGKWFGQGRLIELARMLMVKLQFIVFSVLFVLRSRNELVKILFDRDSMIKLRFINLIRLLGRQGCLVNIVFNHQAAQVWVRDIADLTVLFEIFFHSAYPLQASKRKMSVWDVGSHSGYFAIYCSLLCPKAKISCFEPDKDNYLNSKKNFRLNKSLSKNITAFNFGFSNQDIRARFYKYLFNAHNSLFRFYRPAEEVKVELKSFKKYLKKNILVQVRQKSKAIDLLKIDVEGAEHDMLNGLGVEEFKTIKQIFVEVHDLGDLSRNGKALWLLVKKYYKKARKKDNLYYFSNGG